MRGGSDSAISSRSPWGDALPEIGLVEGAPPAAPDLTLFFANPAHTDIERLLGEVWQRCAPSVLIGCSGSGIVGLEKEVEDHAAISILNLSLPGAELHPLHVKSDDIKDLNSGADWRRWMGFDPERVNAWIVLADPFTFDPQTLVDGLSDAYPSSTIVGGLASGLPQLQETQLFLNRQMYHEGAIVLGVGGAYTIQTVVAQGAAPIGQAWTVTEVERNVIRRIGERTPLEVLQATLEELPEEMRRRASRNLLVGVAMNKYKQSFSRGDFLIRNLMGIDQNTGAIAVNALLEPGQTIQFQIRDAAAADEDLRQRLGEARDHLGADEPAGAMLCTCNGRGVGLFRTPDHDARAIADILGRIPLAGFFCNGEIGPVGPGTYIHGFTASLALFVPQKTDIPSAFQF